MSTIARGIVELELEITGGVDTHRDTHTAAAIDQAGRMLAHQTFPTTEAGYAVLLAWLRSFGPVVLVGVEGTGAYGSALTGYLAHQGIRKASGWSRSTGPAARPTEQRASRTRSTPKLPPAPPWAGCALAPPSLVMGKWRHLRNLRIARGSAISQRATCMRKIKALIVTAPHDLRQRLRGLTNTRLIHTCQNLRPDTTQIGTPDRHPRSAPQIKPSRPHYHPWHDAIWQPRKRSPSSTNSSPR